MQRLVCKRVKRLNCRDEADQENGEEGSAKGLHGSYKCQPVAVNLFSIRRLLQIHIRILPRHGKGDFSFLRYKSPGRHLAPATHCLQKQLHCKALTPDCRERNYAMKVQRADSIMTSQSLQALNAPNAGRINRP